MRMNWTNPLELQHLMVIFFVIIWPFFVHLAKDFNYKLNTRRNAEAFPMRRIFERSVYFKITFPKPLDA